MMDHDNRLNDEEAHDLAALELEADVLECLNGAVVLAHVADREDRGVHHSSNRTSALPRAIRA